jgi:hypothetical protein
VKKLSREIKMVRCRRCLREIAEEESFGFFGEVLCDDCYMDVRSPVKAYDPWAVYLATRTRDSAGLEGVEGLTPLQKDIYEFIKEKGRVTPAELMIHFDITQQDMENVVAILRHREMVRG